MSRWLVGSSSRRTIGLVGEGPGQKDPAFQARGEQPELRILVETGPADHRFDSLVKMPGAGCLQPVLDLFESLQEIRVAPVGQLRRQIVVLPQHLQMSLPAGSDDLIDRSGQSVGDVLGEEGDPRLGALDDLARIRGDIAAEHLQEGGLAGPVPAQKADPFARFDRERRPVQEKRSAETHGDIMDPYLCHQDACLILTPLSA